jgi:hypothetical protein
MRDGEQHHSLSDLLLKKFSPWERSNYSIKLLPGMEKNAGITPMNLLLVILPPKQLFSCGSPETDDIAVQKGCQDNFFTDKNIIYDTLKFPPILAGVASHFSCKFQFLLSSSHCRCSNLS